MSNLKQAAEQIKNFAGRVRGLLDAADAIEAVGNIEQAEKEAISRRDIAVKEKENAEDALKFTLSQVETAKKEQQLEVEKRAKITSDNEIIAAKIITEAREKSELIVQDAKTKAGTISSDISAAKSTLKSLSDEIGSKKNELSEITSKIEAAKKVMSDFVSR